MYPERHGFTLIELLVVIAVIAVLMAILMPALQRAKEQAQEMTCRANLRQYGIAQAVYLDDFDGRYPYAWTSLVKTEQPTGGYERFCRWHDSRYPADGPFWSYLPEDKVHLCPTFAVLAKTLATRHPNHNASIPIDPYYSYSMNAYLGSKQGDPHGSARADSTGKGGVYKITEVTRSRAEVFFFAEENMWTRPGCSWVLNDNALCPDGRDWFGTFHGAKQSDWNGGTINAVFVDAHVDKIQSGLQTTADNRADMSDAEPPGFEKCGWPHRTRFR